MCSRRVGKQGVTLIEILVVVAIFAIIAAVGLPALANALQRARSKGVADVLRMAMRDARSRAIGTGWQFRVFGSNDASGTTPNQFRIEGRRSTALAWPASGVPGPLSSDTISADPWVVLAKEYPGVHLNAGDAGSCPDPLGTAPNSFCITYTPQGLMTTSYQGPGGSLQVSGGRSVTATLAGAVRVQ